MTLDPESFRGMTPSQMLSALLTDCAPAKPTQTIVSEVVCKRCADTRASVCKCNEKTKRDYQDRSKDGDYI
jgi:hypothetical protein